MHDTEGIRGTGTCPTPCTRKDAGRTSWSGWTKTQRALLQTFFQDRFSNADQQYVLACLRRYALHWIDTHGADVVPMDTLDAAAANEVWYHHLRSTQFKRVTAALGTCWLNMVTERAEKILLRAGRATTTRR